MSWVNVAPAAEFKEGEARLVEIEGVSVAVINIGGEYYALEDACTHDGFPLIGCGLPLQEILDGDRITCPRHGARFCARTGAALTPPACEPVTCYPVRIHKGMVQTRNHRQA